VSFLPSLNAALNAICAALLVIGYLFIRSRRIRAHQLCMLSAFLSSVMFLSSYLYYHAHVGVVAFRGQGWIRPVYFSLLLSHTALAAAIVPLALLTLSRALRSHFDRHKRIARWTLPIWLYVSVTGVIIYWLLYHLYAAPAPGRIAGASVSGI
jgi:uncharacterized membrane protein YozB (DUF420 family)